LLAVGLRLERQPGTLSLTEGRGAPALSAFIFFIKYRSALSADKSTTLVENRLVCFLFSIILFDFLSRPNLGHEIIDLNRKAWFFENSETRNSRRNHAFRF